MTPAELITFGEAVAIRHAASLPLIDDLPVASPDAVSDDENADGLAEAIFLRRFTAYESDVEAMFLHYVTGGASLSGHVANTYLNIRDADHARRVTKGGLSFLNWAKPANIKTTAQTYIEHGWPLVDMLAAREQSLADCERVRNRIAHDSAEARAAFAVVQRNFLTTERLFLLTPGQFLRIRNTRLRKTHLTHFAEVLNDTLEALLDPRL